MNTRLGEPWPSLTTSTLTDQVYGVVRDRILAGQVAPGEFVREQEVSDGVGVSRTPVREALGRLASEGFLERIPHRGFRVPEESITDLLELYPILAALEVLAGCEAFPRMEEEDLAELRRINASYAEAFEQRDFRLGIDLNDEFHHALSNRSDNDRLETMLDGLRQTVRRLETWTFTTHPRDWALSLAQHNEIIAAIEDGSFEHALEILKDNRLMTHQQFQREIPALADSPTWEPDESASDHGRKSRS